VNRFIQQIKIIKSKYRSNLTDDHPTELLRTAPTSIQPDLKKLTKKVDTKKYHANKFSIMLIFFLFIK